ncbi:MAG: hypothetical protein U0903_05815 [Planctomycetales bacterium]
MFQRLVCGVLFFPVAVAGAGGDALEPVEEGGIAAVVLEGEIGLDENFLDEFFMSAGGAGESPHAA